jgi:hypothetical protein
LIVSASIRRLFDGHLILFIPTLETLQKMTLYISRVSQLRLRQKIDQQEDEDADKWREMREGKLPAFEEFVCLYHAFCEPF